MFNINPWGVVGKEKYLFHSKFMAEILYNQYGVYVSGNLWVRRFKEIESQEVEEFYNVCLA